MIYDYVRVLGGLVASTHALSVPRKKARGTSVRAAGGAGAAGGDFAGGDFAGFFGLISDAGLLAGAAASGELAVSPEAAAVDGTIFG